MSDLPPPTETASLSARQAHALLDLLSHYEVSHEITRFKNTGVVESYGFPFAPQPGQPSTSPALQPLLAKFVTCAPGMKDIDPNFWSVRAASIIRDLQVANLSESYDKGSIGIRRTVACAMAALFEYPMRGVFAGFNVPADELRVQDYNLAKANDLNRAFRAFMQQAVYSDMVDRVFDKVAKTANLQEHEILAQACHEFGLVNLASFMHYTLIISPKGQSLLALLDQVNKLIPYVLLRQTLKIGNVATMLSAMVRVVLAKMSVTSVTNWIGITASADEGMNLMQTIISTVLGWDVRDIKSKASKVEKSSGCPSKAHLAALKDFVAKSREEKDAIRTFSEEEQTSIVYAILSGASATTELTNEQHEKALEYLSHQLAIRDREQIIKVLCHSSPDNLTQAVRDVVAAYEPIIRQVHNAVDLSDSLGDLEAFLRDMIKLSKLPDQTTASFMKSNRSTPTPTVGDYVLLLKKHQSALHKFLHQIAKNGPGVMQWFHDYANAVMPHFRRQTALDGEDPGPAGDMRASLQSMFSDLPQEKQQKMKGVLDDHAQFIDKMHAASAQRLHDLVTSAPSRASSPTRRAKAPVAARGKPDEPPSPGPGAFLARWQALLDSTLITPSSAQGGDVRHASSGSVLKASIVSGPRSDSSKSRRDEEDEEDEDVFEEAHEQLEISVGSKDIAVQEEDRLWVWQTLGQSFRHELATRGLNW